MPLAPFDELDQAGLRVLGFTIDVTRDGELAFVAGQMQVLLHRSDKSGEDWLTLIITLPNGREFVAHAPRDELKDIADEAFGVKPAGKSLAAAECAPLVLRVQQTADRSPPKQS